MYGPLGLFWADGLKTRGAVCEVEWAEMRCRENMWRVNGLFFSYKMNVRVSVP